MPKPTTQFIRYPLLLEPVFSPRIWGGQRLRTMLGKKTPAGKLIGESWELSDHKHGRSSVANGPYAGKLFGELIRKYPNEMCGLDGRIDRFPLLVKFIDARENLSIQVHPNDAQAKPGERGKNECWYIMDCAPGAVVMAGLPSGMTPEGLRRAARDGSIEALVKRHPIRPGSFVYMPAGTVHAVVGGTMLCEIQQSSDATYRLWDWRRTGRKLQIKDGVAVACYEQERRREGGPFVADTKSARGERKLARNEYFDVRLRAWPRSAGASEKRSEWKFENRHGVILNVVQGRGSWSASDVPAELAKGEFRLGQTWFLPSGLKRLQMETGSEGLRLLVSRSLELAKK